MFPNYGALFLPLLVMLTSVSQSNADTNYSSYAEAGLSTLQKWYNTTSGIYDTTGWWNSANAITMLGNLMSLDSSVSETATNVFSNSFVQAQKHNLNMTKQMTRRGLVRTTYGDDIPLEKRDSVVTINPLGFIDAYNDDDGWWALAWITAYDRTEDQDYLSMAEDIFSAMQNQSAANNCSGGIWWNTDHTYVNAIANELYLSVAAHLSNRASNGSYYNQVAEDQWTWFQNSGMINSENLINDGLTADCKNNGNTVWSYNQGVILGALVEMAKYSPSKASSYIDPATLIANAAIANLTDSGNILHDTCEPNCGADGDQFKGVFMRNLMSLTLATDNTDWKKFIDDNANSIWGNKQRNATATFSEVWDGAFVGPANASTQSSAMDAIVAALAVVNVGSSSTLSSSSVAATSEAARSSSLVIMESSSVVKTSSSVIESPSVALSSEVKKPSLVMESSSFPTESFSSDVETGSVTQSPSVVVPSSVKATSSVRAISVVKETTSVMESSTSGSYTTTGSTSSSSSSSRSASSGGVPTSSISIAVDSSPAESSEVKSTSVAAESTSSDLSAHSFSTTSTEVVHTETQAPSSVETSQSPISTTTPALELLSSQEPRISNSVQTPTYTPSSITTTSSTVSPSSSKSSSAAATATISSANNGCPRLTLVLIETEVEIVTVLA